MGMVHGAVAPRAVTAPPAWWHAALLVGITLALFGASMTGGGAFTYPLDDTYIHISLSRTLALHGVWGVSPDAPAAASSSPLWSVLLAAIYALAGPWLSRIELIAPLVLNLIFGVALVLLHARMLRGLPHPGLLLALVWLATSMPCLAALGMEHVAHVFLVTLFLWATSTDLARGHRATARDLVVLGALTAATATVRYESLFVIAPIGACYLFRRRWAETAVVALAAAVPLVVVGLMWVDAGGWLLPNSLLLKGAGNDHTTDLLARALGVLRQAQQNLSGRSGWIPLAITLLHGAVLMLVGGKAPAAARIFSAVALVATLQHFCLASLGWLFRYEAWILSVNIMGALLLAHGAGWAPRRVLGLAGVCLVLLAPRIGLSYVNVPKAMDDRRWEHVMPAEFVREHLAGQTVFVNDLGVVAWLGDARVIDFFGLGHNEPVRLRRSPGGYQYEQLEAFGQRAGGTVAIVQPCWQEVSRRLPPGWTLVGYWNGPRNVVFRDEIVGFFAMTPDAVPALTEAFNRFPVRSDVRKVLAADLPPFADRDARAAFFHRICQQDD